MFCSWKEVYHHGAMALLCQEPASIRRQLCGKVWCGKKWIQNCRCSVFIFALPNKQVWALMMAGAYATAFIFVHSAHTWLPG